MGNYILRHLSLYVYLYATRREIGTSYNLVDLIVVIRYGINSTSRWEISEEILSHVEWIGAHRFLVFVVTESLVRMNITYHLS